MATSRARGGSAVTSRPAREMLPSSACSRPATRRKSVLLPQPLGPTRTAKAPSTMSRSTPRRTGCTPYAFLTARTTQRTEGADVATGGRSDAAPAGRTEECAGRGAGSVMASRYLKTRGMRRGRWAPLLWAASALWSCSSSPSAAPSNDAAPPPADGSPTAASDASAPEAPLQTDATSLPEAGTLCTRAAQTKTASPALYDALIADLPTLGSDQARSARVDQFIADVAAG